VKVRCVQQPDSAIQCAASALLLDSRRSGNLRIMLDQRDAAEHRWPLHEVAVASTIRDRGWW